MKIYKLNINSRFSEKNLNLTICNFDGIHLGHQDVINQLIENSKKNKYQSSLLSFSPHPRKFFEYSNDNFNIITKMFYHTTIIKNNSSVKQSYNRLCCIGLK